MTSRLQTGDELTADANGAIPVQWSSNRPCSPCSGSRTGHRDPRDARPWRPGHAPATQHDGRVNRHDPMIQSTTPHNVPPSPAHRRTPTAFTLIELLVVVAILALLSAILAPTLRSAMDIARRVTCASQLRQLAVATRLYLINNETAFPTHATGPVMSYYAWAGKRGTEYTEEERFINRYVTVKGKVTEADNEGVFRVFRCPGDNGATAGRWPADRHPSLFDTFGNSYFYNSGGNDNGPDGLHGRKLQQISRPSTVILANDYAFSMYGWQVAIPGPLDVPFQHAYWHHATELGWGNVAFVDAHIEYIRATYANPDYQNGPGWTFAFDGPH